MLIVGVDLQDGNADYRAAVVRICLGGPTWCQMHSVGGEFWHAAFYLPLLDGTVKSKKTKLSGDAPIKRGLLLHTVVYCTCIAIRFIYNKVVRLNDLYTVNTAIRFIYSKGVFCKCPSAIPTHVSCTLGIFTSSLHDALAVVKSDVLDRVQRPGTIFGVVVECAFSWRHAWTRNKTTVDNGHLETSQGIYNVIALALCITCAFTRVDLCAWLHWLGYSGTNANSTMKSQQSSKMLQRRSIMFMLLEVYNKPLRNVAISHHTDMKLALNTLVYILRQE
jgi:hypothetical protein